MYRLHMMPMNIDAENASVFAARLNREVALIGAQGFAQRLYCNFAIFNGRQPRDTGMSAILLDSGS